MTDKENAINRQVFKNILEANMKEKKSEIEFLKKECNKLEHENKQLKINNEFLINYSETLVAYVLEDIKIRNEQREQQLQKLKETMSATK